MKSSARVSPVAVSIIIPVYNCLVYTRRCLHALRSHTAGPSYEVIVIDNASTDGTGEFLARLKPWVKVITNKANLGFARACNQGARIARGGYVVFLNNDTIPSAGWLAALVAVAQRDPKIAVVGAKLLYPNGRVQHAGVVFRQANPIGTRHIYRGYMASAPQVNKERDFQVVTGACMLVRRYVFNSLQGFDEGYVNSFEDVDFCLRVRQAGWRVVYTPRSVLVHHESVSPGRHLKDQENMQRLNARWAGKIKADADLYYRADSAPPPHPNAY
ncbi:hypothetical protein SY88_22400 [Clostridiales bacterium PH28_bin88]|nr:hypothetical protein SY88_22400 [Clostridiales bacterium PH28_bin88]